MCCFGKERDKEVEEVEMQRNVKRKSEEIEGFIEVNSPTLQSAGLFNFYSLQAELTTVGRLLFFGFVFFNRELEVIEKKGEIRKRTNAQHECIHCATFYYLVLHVDFFVMGFQTIWYSAKC